MKTKKFNRKLALNKKTIANLNFNEMNVVLGGELTDNCTTDCTQLKSVCPHLCPPPDKSIGTCVASPCDSVMWTCACISSPGSPCITLPDIC